MSEYSVQAQMQEMEMVRQKIFELERNQSAIKRGCLSPESEVFCMTAYNG